MQNDEKLFLIEKQRNRTVHKMHKKEMGGSKNEKKDFGSFVGVNHGTFISWLWRRF